jgi:homogentisate 1,2-dioxygenase
MDLGLTMRTSLPSLADPLTANDERSEAIQGALPIGANSLQKPPYGLYAEKLSGTAFTAPRSENLQSWLYRILPSAYRSSFEPYAIGDQPSADLAANWHHVPNQLR